MNMPGFVAPYHDITYHSKEYPGGYHPQDAKELFNLRHSLLRNATERTFEALKARFPILLSAPPYPLQTQVKLVVATCAIHNYIRRENPDDWFFRLYEQDHVPHMEDSLPQLEAEQLTANIETPIVDVAFETEELEITSQLRDSIAAEIWSDYINDISPM